MQIKIPVFWVMTPCRSVYRYHLLVEFDTTVFLVVQDSSLTTLKTETASCSETLEPLYHSTLRRISEDWSIFIYLFVYLSIYLSLYLSIYLSICLSVWILIKLVNELDCIQSFSTIKRAISGTGVFNTYFSYSYAICLWAIKEDVSSHEKRIMTAQRDTIVLRR